MPTPASSALQPLDEFIAVLEPTAVGTRAWLRAMTGDAHDRVDGAGVMQALMAGHLSSDDYRDLLRALYRLFRCIECDYAQFLRAASARGWHYISRADLLASDLAPDIPDVALPPRNPEPSVAAGWGALYVIEGSTLGARLIRARLRATFPDGLPLRYFSHAADDPTHWRRFERILERELADPSLHADALVGARATFAAFAHTLESIDA